MYRLIQIRLFSFEFDIIATAEAAYCNSNRVIVTAVPAARRFDPKYCTTIEDYFSCRKRKRRNLKAQLDLSHIIKISKSIRSLKQRRIISDMVVAEAPVYLYL